MTKTVLLEALREFTENCYRGYQLSAVPDNQEDILTESDIHVFLMHTPTSNSKRKCVPYVVHSVLTGSDQQKNGNFEESIAIVRSVFTVYNSDEQQGSLELLEMMERFRISLLEERVIGKQFVLNLEEKLESLIYPDISKTAPFYTGEMSSVWNLPIIRRKVKIYE